MKMTDLIREKGTTYEARRVLERAMRDAKPGKATKAPADIDARLLPLYWEGIAAMGGIRPKTEEEIEAAKRAAVIAKMAASSGPYEVRRKGGKPSPAELLREVLGTAQGRKLIQAIKGKIDEQIERRGTASGIQLAIELARWDEETAGMKGEWKVDNDIASAIARWLLACWPNSYAGKIEIRGEAPAATSWPWLNVRRPYEPCWTTPAGSAVPAKFSSIYY